MIKHIQRKQEIVDGIKKEKKREAQQRYEIEQKERVDKWHDRFGISKTGSEFDITKIWFEKNKKEITVFVISGGNEIGNMSSKISKRVAWAICNNKRFDAVGINSNSLSHIIR